MLLSGHSEHGNIYARQSISFGDGNGQIKRSATTKLIEATSTAAKAPTESNNNNNNYKLLKNYTVRAHFTMNTINYEEPL